MWNWTNPTWYTSDPSLHFPVHVSEFLPWLEFLWHTSAASLRNPARFCHTCTGGARLPYTRGASLRPARKLGPDVYRQGTPRHSSAPSFVQPCKLGPGVYRHAAPTVLVGPEFTDPLQTRGRRVPAPAAARTRGARVYGPPANSRQKCTGGVRQGSRRCQLPLHGTRRRSSPGSKARVNTRVRWSCQSRGKVPGSASWPGHRCTRPA